MAWEVDWNAPPGQRLRERPDPGSYQPGEVYQALPVIPAQRTAPPPAERFGTGADKFVDLTDPATVSEVLLRELGAIGDRVAQLQLGVQVLLVDAAAALDRLEQEDR